MNINSDINILGSLPDWNLINVFLKESIGSMRDRGGVHAYTAIKTDKSIKRFEKAISATLINFCNAEVEVLIRKILTYENISQDSLLILFWNSCFNNELFHYLNNHVYFPAFFSGRLVLKKEEVSACIKDLKETEPAIKNWTIETIDTVARKYLTLLMKFNLMEGSLNKKILHPYLNDKMFVHFVYWITAIETKPNLLESGWLKYSFCERPVFIERLMQRKFSKYFELLYTGDKLKIETLVPYETIYHDLK